MIHMTDVEFQTISLYIRENYGINLEKKKYLLESKLWIELAKTHAADYTDYWQKLRMDTTGSMEQRMMNLLTTNYSYFMRENKHFEFLRDKVVTELAKSQNKALRILCAGCSAGQEAYTVAMYLMDEKQMGHLKVPFEIIGIDLSEKMVLQAKKATYGSDDYARLPGRWRECYCEPFKEGQFTLSSKIRESVHVYRHNLMEPLVHCRECFQIVFCRNVLIYIQEPQRRRILKNIIDTLQPGGYLFLGHTESLMNGMDRLKYIQPAIYRKE